MPSQRGFGRFEGWQIGLTVESEEGEVPHLRWSQAPPLPWPRPGSADPIPRSIPSQGIGARFKKALELTVASLLLGFDAVALNLPAAGGLLHPAGLMKSWVDLMDIFNLPSGK